MQNKFTQKAQNTLRCALSEAGNLGHSYVGSEHILLGLATEKDSIAARILSGRGLSATVIKNSIIEISGEGDKCHPSSRDMTSHAKSIIEASGNIAHSNGCTYIGTEHLLAALLAENGAIGLRIIEGAGVPPSLLQSDLSSHQSSFSLSRPKETTDDTQAPKRSKSSHALSLYSRDLTRLAQDGKTDPTIGREAETERTIQILSRRQKNNPCLIGEPGVGKTAIVEGLAKRISDGDVPQCLLGKRILCLDIPSMIAGAKYRGEFEDRMKSVMAEAQKDPDIILFIDEIHVIVGAGAAEGAVDAANILKPSLARGELRVIGATTTAEYKKYIEKDSALERRFQSVMVEEPSEQTAIEVLRGLRTKYEEHHGVSISDEAISAAVRLSSRYVNDRFLPDKAIDLIDEAAAKCSMRGSEQDPSDSAPITVTQKHIADALTSWTGIPMADLLGDEGESLLSLEERLRRRIVGQDEAIRAVCNAIRRGRAGFNSPARPIGSFVFLGNSGVGKTELALAVAEELLGTKKTLLRFDMSEYMERHSVSRLIGSPPGYVGYGEGGLLTERVRRRPYCVVLFDEIEKAHPDIFNLLLQILEDGKLTDAQGREVDFCNAVIIMTSNIGADRAGRISGFCESEQKKSSDASGVISSFKKSFRSEFINRIDEIIVFDDLDLESLTKIASMMLSGLSERIRVAGVDIVFDDSLAPYIAEQSAKERCGARNIRRIITSCVENKLALRFFDGTLKSAEPIVFSKKDAI